MESRIGSDMIIASPVFKALRKYLEDSDSTQNKIYIFVPFIQTDILTRLLDKLQSNVIIVTTWKPEDLLSGISELKLYELCKQRGITLYINNRIHLKVYSNDFNDLILSSANISAQGLGLKPGFNFECTTHVPSLNSTDLLYFSQILKSSIYVDNELYTKLKEWLESQEKIEMPTLELEDIVSLKHEDSFLISALPMTKSIDLLKESYQKLSMGHTIEDPEIRNCVSHDLANYSIDLGLTDEQFHSILKEKFFEHPFIQKIDEIIAPETYFGRIKVWVQNNCTTVPVPSRRELTENVQVLLEWFEKLGDGKYVIDIPKTRSQRITKVRS